MRFNHIILLSLVALAACSEDSLRVDPSPSMPLAVGNTWIYRLSNGALDTFTIVDAITDNGETWYRANDSMMYANRSDGLWSRYQNEARHLTLVAPAKGDTANFQTALVLLPGTNGVEQVFYREVTSNDTLLTVPAGAFSTVEYAGRVTYGKLIHDIRERYAPGIGLVHGTYPMIMRATAERTLVAYHLH